MMVVTVNMAVMAMMAMTAMATVLQITMTGPHLILMVMASSIQETATVTTEDLTQIFSSIPVA